MDKDQIDKEKYDENQEEYEEDWEESDDELYDAEDMFHDAGEKVKKVLGVDAREEYDSPYEHIRDHVAYHGVIGVVRAAVVVTAAIIAETARVVFSTLMGSRDHFRFGDAVRQAMNAKELNRPQNEINDREDPERNEDEYEIPKEQTIDEKIKESSERIDELLQDQEQKDEFIKACLDRENIINEFDSLHIIPIQEEGTDRIYLFSKNQEMDLQNILCISKNEMLTGNANSLTAALYQYNDGKNMQDKLEAALQSVITVAKVREEMQGDLYQEIRSENQNHDVVSLSHVVFDTDEHNCSYMAAVLAPENHMIDLFYNNSRIATLNLQEKVPNSVMEDIYQKYQTDKEKSYHIKDISFVKEGMDQVKIQCNGSEELFNVKEESDLLKVSQFIETHSRSAEYAQASAILIGAVINPEIKETRNEDGFAINPWTEKMKCSGDIRIENHGIEMQISKINLVAEGSITKENNELITRTYGYGSDMDLNSMVEKIKVIIDEPYKEDPLAQYQLPTENQKFESLFESPIAANGEKAYQELKDKSVMEGLDISAIHFKSSESSKNIEEVISEKNYPKRHEIVHESDFQSIEPSDSSIISEEGVITYEDLVKTGFTLDGQAVSIDTGDIIEELEH